MKKWTVVLVAALATVLHADDLKGKTEITGSVGIEHLENDGNLHSVVGASAGYGLLKNVQAFGEYEYIHFGSAFKVLTSAQANTYGGGFRVNAVSTKKVELYGLVAGGGAHFSISDKTGSDSENDGYLQAGGGVRILAAPNWGIAPEIRWTHVYASGDNNNLVSYTVGFFFRFGKK